MRSSETRELDEFITNWQRCSISDNEDAFKVNLERRLERAGSNDTRKYDYVDDFDANDATMAAYAWYLAISDGFLAFYFSGNRWYERV